eukprot:3710971-Pleurochrysis_carterae.AAC.1
MLGCSACRVQSVSQDGDEQYRVQRMIVARRAATKAPAQTWLLRTIGLRAASVVQTTKYQAVLLDDAPSCHTVLLCEIR